MSHTSSVECEAHASIGEVHLKGAIILRRLLEVAHVVYMRSTTACLHVLVSSVVSSLGKGCPHGPPAQVQVPGSLVCLHGAAPELSASELRSQLACWQPKQTHESLLSVLAIGTIYQVHSRVIGTNATGLESVLLLQLCAPYLPALGMVKGQDCQG